MATDKRFGRLNLDPTVAIALCTKGDSRSVVEISGDISYDIRQGQSEHHQPVLLRVSVALSA